MSLELGIAVRVQEHISGAGPLLIVPTQKEQLTNLYRDVSETVQCGSSDSICFTLSLLEFWVHISIDWNGLVYHGMRLVEVDHVLQSIEKNMIWNPRCDKGGVENPSIRCLRRVQLLSLEI